MMLLTRPLDCIGGGLAIYYINLTLSHSLSPAMQARFIWCASAFIVLAVIVTLLLAMWGTRNLRRVLRLIAKGREIPVELGRIAGVESVTFAQNHHLREAIIDPLVTVAPMCLTMWVLDDAPVSLLLQIAAGGFVGISAVLMLTFFATERWIVPVTHLLQSHGVVIDYDRLPRSRLGMRLNLCFGLTLAITALMIGSLANQRAFEIVQNPASQMEAVASLREHTVGISITAVAVGLLLSHFLSSSVSTRVDHLVAAMQRVKSGRLDERLMPVGNDEIDHLAREFNTMVEQLNRNDAMIRELNSTLEEKVRLRTRQLMRSKKTLQRSFRKLRETDRLKTEFFSNVSHELRTPLTMILAPVQRLLEQSDALPERDRSLLDVVRLNGLRLLELINQLLEFSRVGSGKEELRPESLHLNRLVESLVRSAEPLAEQRGVRLTARLEATLPLTSADPDKLETVIRNLVSNALKFTPQGGAVHVETRLQNDRLLLSVADTGIGIKPEDHNRIFDRFVQIDGSRSRAFSGTGLGLSLARELIELHGGTIGVDSELGRGATFWIELPVVKPLVPVAAAISPTASGMRSTFAELQTFPGSRPIPAVAGSVDETSPLILIVDDTPEMRFLIGDVLSDHYRIELAADGFEALETLERLTPDLVISDVMMPGLDGYELCHRVRADARWCNLPFVLLTARAETSMKIEGLQCGADDYLVKPFDAEELRARVRSLLRVRDLHRQLEVKNRDLESTLRDVKAMQSQLVHSEKMNSIGQLVAGVAHEINNAINAVYNGIQPLASKVGAVREILTAREASGRLDVDIDRGLTRISSLAEV
ncbi:MAG TPA: ATP-binding protein, partial [Planctomycetaceae bacterium]|nr:ATP-binding protein [Planctomycetaceae bacterium]